ncbi:MAG: hypothetical protein U0228_07595 [Myxococcaceae bacterium]
MINRWAAAESLAAAQESTIRLDQLISCGLTYSQVRTAVTQQRLSPMMRELFRFTSRPPSWRQWAWALTRLVAHGSALSHWTAAWLWGLPDVQSPEALGVVHVTVPRKRVLRVPDASVVVHRPLHAALRLERKDDQLYVTRIARTLIDVASLATEEHLETMLDAAHLRFGNLIDWLHLELRGRTAQHTHGLSTLQRLLVVRAGPRPAESPLETRLHRLLRREGFRFTPQHDVFDAEGQHVARIDAAFVHHRVAVMADSYQWHSSRAAFDHDATQRARLVSLGWVVVPVTHASLGAEFVAQLRSTLARNQPQQTFFARS